MTHLNALIFPDILAPVDSATLAAARCQAVVLVVSDNPEVASVLDNICDFLGFGVELLTTHEDLAPILRRYRPMAVVAELNGQGQDGCHVMMQVADHDPSLPILMLTGLEPGLAGAADAVEELWNLTSVTKSPELPKIGHLVEFLFHAGRRGDCVRMMPV
jgi:DNA-binding NtrC family response regulator